MTDRNLRHAKFVGSMPPLERSLTLAEFKRDPSLRILLISLGSGGAGLNLQSANHVLLADPWWNPAVEEQAIARSHRLGSTFPCVNVVKFITADSIEERVEHLKAMKKLMYDCVIDKCDEAAMELDLKQVEFLFDVSPMGQNPKKKRHREDEESNSD